MGRLKQFEKDTAGFSTRTGTFSHKKQGTKFSLGSFQEVKPEVRGQTAFWLVLGCQSRAETLPSLPPPLFPSSLSPSSLSPSFLFYSYSPSLLYPPRLLSTSLPLLQYSSPSLLSFPSPLFQVFLFILTSCMNTCFSSSLQQS